MLIIKNNNDSAYFNLACEEYLLNNFNKDIFMLWHSVPSILIGKNQNTYSEINIEYVEDNKIPVVRRMSGGGTVFCDLGNINFTFIEKATDKSIDFKKFTAPIIKIINQLGAQASFSGRNDLVIDGKKFSGNAQYRSGNRILHHGTLLYDSTVSNLSKALTPMKIKFQDKSVKSVASRVTNIKSHIELDLSTEEFRHFLMDQIFQSDESNNYYTLTNKDIDAINTLVYEKYNTWDWNYGSSPNYSYSNSIKTSAGVIEIQMDIKHGLIEKFKLYGDFFTKKSLEILESTFINQQFTPKNIEDIINKSEVESYINNLSKDDFKLLFEELMR